MKIKKIKKKNFFFSFPFIHFMLYWQKGGEETHNILI